MSNPPPRIREFDAYLVHASPDKDIARRIADYLQDRGLKVWFNSFTLGASLRRSMERGLRDSTLGVLLVSPSLLTNRRWVERELDALYALEEDMDLPRLFPVWMGVDAETVASGAPMLSGRFALSVNAPEELTDDRLEELYTSILERTALESPAQRLRAQVSSGLRWQSGPVFLRESLEYYDANLEHFAMVALSHLPDMPHPRGRAATPLALKEMLKAPEAYDGEEVSVLGRQTAETLQVLEVPKGLPLDAMDGKPVRAAAWVFQMHTTVMEREHTMYVYAWGPYHPRLSPELPPGRLCMVTGVAVAYGSVDTVGRSIAPTVYFAANTIASLPEMGSGDE